MTHTAFTKRSLAMTILCTMACLTIATPLLMAQDTPPPVEPVPVEAPTKQEVKEVADVFRAHDAEISAHLSAIFGQISGLAKTTHTVDAGLVTLRGEVDELSQRQRAEAIAAKLAHVIAVQNLIHIVQAEAAETPGEMTADDADQALKERLTEIFAAVDGLKEIKVKVKSGIVTLSGQVSGDDERTQARELTQKVDGVVYVVNNLEVPTEISERVGPALSQIKALVTKTVSVLPLLVISLLLLFATWAAARGVRNWQWPYRKLEDRPLIRQIVRQIVSTAVFVGGLLLIFELLDVTAFIGALLGTAGLAGLAVGFAFQDIVENYLASLMLSARQPYKKGDVVLVADYTGMVMRMTMRDTVLMTFDGNHVRIPNAQVFKSVLTNYTHNPRRRFQVQVGVGTEENLLDVHKQGIAALESINGVIGDPAPFMTIDELGDSNVVCTFYGWVDQRAHDFFATRTEAIRRIKVRFDREGFDMPEPIYRVQITERNEITVEDGAPPTKRRESEPLEDDTMQNSINEQRNLDDEADKEDQRGDEDIL